MGDTKKLIPKIDVIDLFCGAGGLTSGLEKSGITVKLGVDNDPACQYPYTVNNNADFLLKSVNDLGAKELADTWGTQSVRLLAGCPPCQTFSTYNQKADASDKRWWLLEQFGRLVCETEPELVAMENVPGLKNQDVFKMFVEGLKRQDYHVHYQVVCCDRYGLPQKRRRLVLLASKLGPVELLSPSEFGREPCTVRDAIGGLPPIVAGGVDSVDGLHRSAGLSERNLLRIRASKPGGTWADWPDGIKADCHKRDSGSTFSSVYGRMDWDKPAPTVTTQFYSYGSGRFGHPVQDRALSLREGAILQGFPVSYQFAPPGCVNVRTVGRLVGNAVPVLLGELVGTSFIVHVADCGRL